MKKYMSSTTKAENEGGVHLSKSKVELVRDNLMGLTFLQKVKWNSKYDKINEFMQYGDTQPAYVVSLHPLIISAYSDEIDGVVLLEFPPELGSFYDLTEGARLVTSNVYAFGTTMAPDLIPGEGNLNRYVNFTPIVQIFLAEEEDFARERISLFEEEKWERVVQLTEEKMRDHSQIPPRNGFFFFS